MQDNVVRLAIVGGKRGGRYKVSTFGDKVRLVAVCDQDEQLLKVIQENNPELLTYTSYEALLDNPDIDAVLLATPLFIHARQAIQAMRAGKHVLSEVIAAHTIEDAWELVETVEQTGMTYMLAENFCYTRPNMMVLNMIRKGAFGQITHAEGAYLHDVRHLTHNPDGSLTWRGNLHQRYNGMNYPTHSLGPVAKWLDIGNEDHFDYMTTFTSASATMNKYYKEYFGDDHPGSKPGFWKQGDSATTLIRTKKGVTITLRVDWISSRPHNMYQYALQGTHGAYVSSRHEEEGEDPLVWIQGKSTGLSEMVPGKPLAKWDSLYTHTAEYDHPLWQQWGEQAVNAGHKGGDFFTVREFADAILEKRKPFIDVYDAVAWSSVFPLSMQSVQENGKPMYFPDFQKKRSEKS